MSLKTLTLIALVWVLITFLSGLNATHNFFNQPALLHPLWALLTAIPVMAVILIRDKHRPPREQSGFLPVIGVAIAVFTGIGFAMGFLPFFWHRVIVWVVVTFLGYGLLKNLRNGN